MLLKRKSQWMFYNTLNQTLIKIYQNLWALTKVLIIGKFIAFDAQIKIKTENQNLSFHLKKLEKE